jgi:prepilin-type N-terminal cleavage/methylation domain-containing protein/prepilin-type processing-associated H-X9-DG protein
MKCSCSSLRTCRAFTLVELLVVIAIIGVLVALLLPAVQAAREAARRMSCQNNLKQLGLAIHNYESAHKTFPPGGQPAPGTSNNYGVSWLAIILPYTEQNSMYDKMDLTGATAPQTGVVYFRSGFGNAHNGNLLRGKFIKTFWCPSSNLARWALQSIDPPGPEGVMSPTYVGISGGTQHPDSTLIVNKDGNADPHNATGRLSKAGVLVSSQQIRIGQITDGTSNTLAAGEQSSPCLTAAGQKVDCRSDFGHGFPMGPSTYAANQRDWNITSVRYAINTRAYNLTGIGDIYYGNNRPIQSAHPGGANVLFADGSVRLLVESTSLTELMNLCNRDDGNVNQ